MSIGKNIKQLRELRNFTQAYMAEQLHLSVSGYGKIERDETDVSISRLEEIGRILDTDYKNILSFDEKQVFNFTYNQNANGIVQNQQIVNDDTLKDLVHNLIEESKSMRIFLSKIIDKLKL